EMVGKKERGVRGGEGAPLDSEREDDYAASTRETGSIALAHAGPAGSMTHPTSMFYARLFALVTAAVLGIALFKMIEPFIGAILWAVLLAFLLFPLNRALRRLLRGSRGAAAMG